MDHDRLGELLDELLQGWARFVDAQGPRQSSSNGRSEKQIVVIMTLTAHVHATATILRPVLPAGLTVAHMPLVRSIFEATVTVAWCDEVADGANGLINEGSRQRRALRKELAKTESMNDMAAMVSNAQFTTLPTTSADQAKRIQQRFDDIAVDGGYALYRILSGLSHASIEMIDGYLDGDSFRPGEPMSILSESGPMSTSVSWAHLIASCLVWAGRVTDFLDRERSRRNDLRRIARELKVDEFLRIKYSAHRRGRTTS